MSNAQLAGIRQLVVEFDPHADAERTAAVARLAETHCLVHLYASNAAPIRAVEGVPVPSLFEATYVRRTEFAEAPRLSSDPIPGPLDQPNLSESSDIYLSGYPYNDATVA